MLRVTIAGGRRQHAADGRADEERRERYERCDDGQSRAAGDPEPEQHDVPGHVRREHPPEAEIADGIDEPVENVIANNARASGWRMLLAARPPTGSRSGRAPAGIALMTNLRFVESRPAASGCPEPRSPTLENQRYVKAPSERCPLATAS